MLSSSLLVIVMDMTILNVALPELTQDLKPSASEQLWIIDIYSLFLAGLLVPLSALADRWGRKRMLISGFFVFGGASLLIIAADSPTAVIAIRALLGVGGAMIMPTTLSMIRTIFTDPAERAKALGLWAAVSSVGIALGPIVGGLLLEHFSWQAAFLVNVPLMILAVIAGLVLLPETKDPSPGKWDGVATALSIVGMVALVWSIKEFAKYGLDDLTAWATFTASIALIATFVRRCLNRDDPLLDVRLFTRKPFTAGVIAAITSMFALAALLLLVSQWLQLVEGTSPLGAGVRLLPLAGGAMIISLIAPHMANRFGARAALSGGIAVAGIGFLVLFLAGSDLTYSAVAISLALLGGGAGSLAIASAIIMSGTPVEKAGNAAAIEETAYDLGTVLGVAILGSVAAAIYRSDLVPDSLAGGELSPDSLSAARESLGGALEVAGQLNLPALATQASSSFTTALVDVGLIGGILMLGAALAIYMLVPKDLDINSQQH